MVAKPLPTGEEPPKGYELLYADLDKDNDSQRVTRVSATQLTSIEKREIDRIRQMALTLIKAASGVSDLDITFEEELGLWPKCKRPSDKLVYRCYVDGELRGYAIVVSAWPDANSWTIQHLIVEPSYRLKGIGMHVVQAIEEDVLNTTEGVDTLVSFPFALADNGFWPTLGFERGESETISFRGLDFTTDVYRKTIR